VARWWVTALAFRRPPPQLPQQQQWLPVGTNSNCKSKYLIRIIRFAIGRTVTHQRAARPRLTIRNPIIFDDPLQGHKLGWAAALDIFGNTSSAVIFWGTFANQSQIGAKSMGANANKTKSDANKCKSLANRCKSKHISHFE
jgi:hypothetical protein